jgi:RNA polymerase sigma-70 factor (ECF subfamily)
MAVAALSEADVTSFQSVRPRLFGIAYRVLGSANDADDVVQDAWIRWQDTDRRKVRDAAAFLAATTRRLAINVTQSARARRELHVVPSLPEPADAEADPALEIEQREALERAVQMLLENLSPAERAAYVLREGFDYPYRQISEVLGVSEANARQIAVRARRHLSGDVRRPVAAPEQRALLDAIVEAAETGDLAQLELLLTADLIGGGGEVVPLAPVKHGSPERLAA